MLVPCVDPSGPWEDTGKELLFCWITSLDLSEHGTFLLTDQSCREGLNQDKFTAGVVCVLQEVTSWPNLIPHAQPGR